MEGYTTIYYIFTLTTLSVVNLFQYKAIFPMNSGVTFRAIASGEKGGDDFNRLPEASMINAQDS